ncbi:hypothetical protein IAR55_000149 [Kwoniella newhampshirensis]|uniref:Glutaredoxin domain-containing protein n=1 Tax=Kwoniella newhampshirensis TaxID=1651941 RepID=A0AAW0Z5V2_9TREE
MAPPPVSIYVTSLTSAPKVRKYIELLRSSLRALEIPYEEHDLVMDEDAKKRWQRAKPPGVVVGLPGYLVGGEWVGTMEDFEDAVETQTLESFLKQDLDLSAPPATSSSSSSDLPESSSQRTVQEVELEKLMKEMTDQDLDQLIADLDVNDKSRADTAGTGIGNGIDTGGGTTCDPTFGARVGAGAGGSGMGGKGEDTGSELIDAALNGSGDAGVAKEKEGNLVEQVRAKVEPVHAEETTSKKVEGKVTGQETELGDEDKEDEASKQEGSAEKRGKGDTSEIKQMDKDLLDQILQETALDEKEDRDVARAEKSAVPDQEKKAKKRDQPVETRAEEVGIPDVRETEEGLLDELKKETLLEDKEEREIGQAIE